jgi:energy-coupling factor transport system permease protein
MLTLIKLTKIKVCFFLKSLKNIFSLILITSLLNIFFTDTGKLFLRFYFLKITFDGIYYACNSIFKFLIMILSSSLLILTTSPLELSKSLVNLLSPLKKIVPINDLAMILNISLRFIPVISQEFEIILKSQTARGINFKDKNLINRVKNYLALLIPIFVISFKRADDLAIAMESRCYNPENTRKIKKIKLNKRDYFFLLFQVLFIIFIIFIDYYYKILITKYHNISFSFLLHI